MIFSIVTAVLNDTDNIEKTIMSVANQGVDVQHIVIDGGSTDGTVEIIKKYETSLTYWSSEKDDGIADAFNKGIKQCTGEIVGIVNSGDFLELDALQKVLGAFEQNDCDIVYGNARYWQNGQKEYIYKANHLHLDKFMSINHPAVFVRKSVYDKFGLFDKTYKYAMDYELMLRFYLKGCKFCYIDEVLSNMALGGVSDKNWPKAYFECYQIKRGYGIDGAFLYFLGISAKRVVRNTLSVLGLESVISWYRQNISTVKKSL